MPDIRTSTILDHLPIDPSSKYTPIALATALVLLALCLYRSRRNRRRTPKLLGPPSKGFLYGVNQDLSAASDLGALYVDWERKYGPVYEIPSGLGSKMLVLGDPKGIAHHFANDTTIYRHSRFAKALEERFFGTTLLKQEGETHRRLRRALSSGFSVSAIRNLVPAFLDSGIKLTSEWNILLDSEFQGGITIDIQKWMNYVSLDSMGKGAFSHDFQSLVGNPSPVMEAFGALGSIKPTLFATIASFMIPIFPRLAAYMPTEQAKVLKALSASMREVAENLLAKDAGDASILGALIRSETASSSVQMSIGEIHAQNMIMLAGFEPPSITLSWALIELARNPEIQNSLRAELEEHIPAEGVTYEKISKLPYLDAVLSETLRLHPAAPDTIREVTQDDIIPLGQPIVTASGTVIDCLPVERGSTIRVPIIGVNRSEALWGPNASTFDPTRWLEEKAGDKRKKEIQGYKHLLTFSHGPRTCLGKMFAVTEVKVVLSVIVRHFTFEFPGGPETKLGVHQSLNPLPKVVGEEGPSVPMTIRKV